MNAAQRAPYMDQVNAEYTAYLLGEQDCFRILCQWCQYFWQSGGSNDDDYDASCDHPLPAVSEHLSERVMIEAIDCWGFTPTLDATCYVDRGEGPYGRWTKRVPGLRLLELINLGEDGQAMLLEEKAER